MPKTSKPAAWAAVGMLLIGLLAWTIASFTAETSSDQKPRLGLISSLPIYWGESADFDVLASGNSSEHWVRTHLEQSYVLQPLDYLAAPDTVEASPQLAALDNLLLAQPAPLPPADYAALDTWVRDGGALLLFADPMLTEHSAFGLGDKRRPQDVALLSPILARWGLAQIYDPAQPGEERMIDFGGVNVPIRQAGAVRIVDPGAADCENMDRQNLVVHCRIGKGIAVIVSDAAMLDGEAVSPADHQALAALLTHTFAAR